MIGLSRVDHVTDESHRYTTLTGSVDRLTNELVLLVTGSLARYGNTGDAEARATAVEALQRARAEVASIEHQEAAVHGLRMQDAVAAYLTLAREVLDQTDQFMAEIDGGANVASAPSTGQVLAAGSALLNGQQAFSAASEPVSLRLDQDRRNALQYARYLLGAAVLIAVLIMFGLTVSARRRVRRTLADLLHRRDSAERLAAHRADVVNMASHELRNPITALTLSTQLLLQSADSGDSEELRTLATHAHSAAMQCNSLVNELLDLGRLDADRLDLRTGATPLQPALADAIAMCQALHGSRSVEFSGDLDLSVQADPDRLRVILRNLIDNAFKFSPTDSRVFVSVAHERDRVRVDIRDEGMGVPAEFRERIFQRFERSRTASHVGGVGIGLFLSRELARRMEGDLRCADCPRGAQFELVLRSAT